MDLARKGCSGVKIAALKIKTIQKVEKQKQYISENGKNLRKKTAKKIKTMGKKDRILPFDRKRSCLLV